jgi:secretion/DNA translocation related TadE-like protein
MRPPSRGDEGNVSLLVLAGAAMVMVLLVSLADLAAFLLARARAQTAADAGALAAAAELVPLVGGEPQQQAERFVEANGARLRRCACPQRGDAATVAVDVPVRFVLLRVFGLRDVEAVARAEVDLGRLDPRVPL